MVTRTASGKKKVARLKRKPTREPDSPVYGVRVPEALHDAIEVERDTLAKAESLLGCLMISMEYETDPVSGPYYPHVAQIARDLVRQSINGLDSFTLKQCVLRNKVKEAPVPFDESRDTRHYHTLVYRNVPLPRSLAIQ